MTEVTWLTITFDRVVFLTITITITITFLTITFDRVVFLTITITITITFLTIAFDRVVFLSPRKGEDHLQERWKPITDMHLGKV